MIERQPMHEGYEAGIQGLDPRMCPYEKLSKEWREWQMWHGWGTEIGRAMTEAVEVARRNGATIHPRVAAIKSGRLTP
jgi:ribosome modulation factor